MKEVIQRCTRFAFLYLRVIYLKAITAFPRERIALKVVFQPILRKRQGGRCGASALLVMFASIGIPSERCLSSKTAFRYYSKGRGSGEKRSSSTTGGIRSER